MTVKNSILFKFRDLAYRFGIKRLTIDILAKECGISKKTVYKYFSSKDELVHHLTDTIFGSMKEEFDSINKTENNPVQKLYRYFELSFTVFRNFSSVLLEDVQRHYPEINKKIQRFLDDYIELFMESYTQGVEKGLFRDLNPKFVAGFFRGASTYVFRAEFILENNLTVEETLYSFRTLLISSLVK